MVEKERIIDKVRKLLAKAEGTTNEHEADVFLAKAQEYMVQHAIEAADLLEAGGKQEDIEVRTIEITPNKPRTDALRGFLSALAESFNCRMWYTTLKNPRTGRPMRDDRSNNNYIAGFVSDVEFVELLFYSIQLQQHRALLEARRLAKREYEAKGIKFRSNVWNRNFIEAYLSRVASRMRDRYVRIEETHGHSVALAIRDRRTIVDLWMEENMGEMKESKQRSKAYEPYARQAGSAAGETADISGGRGHIADVKRKELD